MAHQQPSTSSLALAGAAFCAGIASGAALFAAYERNARRRALMAKSVPDLRDRSDLRHAAAALTDIIVRYHNNLQCQDESRGDNGNDVLYPVRPKMSPGDLRERLPLEAPEEPESYAAIFRDVEEVLLPCLTHWESPNFFAYFKCCSSNPGILAEFLMSSLNIVGFTWAAGPGATELEQVMMDWAARMLRLPECFLSTTIGGGVIQPSASEATLCAMIAAREEALKGHSGSARTNRLDQLVVYLSDQTHSSGEKDCAVLGIRNVRILRTYRNKADDDNYAIAPDDLQAAIERDVADGLVPFFLIATVGTTSTAAIDPIQQLAQVAKAQTPPVWVHIDGAYGGAAAVCPEFRGWLNGVDECDSICVNAHKWMLVGFDCTLLWVKDRRPLIQALTLDPEYLKSDYMSQVNYKDWQVGLGRRFRSLKLWFAFRRFGVDGFRQHIRRSIHLAKRAEELLRADGRFEIFTRARMGLVTIALKNESRAVSEQLLRRVNDSGKAFLVHSVVDGRHILRLAMGGLEVDEWHIDRVVDVLRGELTRLLAGTEKNNRMNT